MKYMIHWDSKVGDETTSEYYTGIERPENSDEFEEAYEFSRLEDQGKIFNSLYICSGTFLKLCKKYEGCDLGIMEID